MVSGGGVREEDGVGVARMNERSGGRTETRTNYKMGIAPKSETLAQNNRDKILEN